MRLAGTITGSSTWLFSKYVHQVVKLLKIIQTYIKGVST
jgi:hypothetical protein